MGAYNLWGALMNNPDAQPIITRGIQQAILRQLEQLFLSVQSYKEQCQEWAEGGRGKEQFVVYRVSQKE